MSFRREFAKVILAEIVASTAADRARRLRASARRDSAGIYRDIKRGAADVSDEIADDPQPIVDLIEALWDSPRRGAPERQ